MIIEVSGADTLMNIANPDAAAGSLPKRKVLRK